MGQNLNLYLIFIKSNKLKSFKKFFIILLFFLIYIIKLPFRTKFLLCTTAKQENKYIKEFVEYYQKLNVDKIIIYDNNDIKGENFQGILKNDITSGFVKIINFRGIKKPQSMALNDCYKRFNNNYDWIAFFDIDEFLHIINYTDIKKFLILDRFKKCKSIIINWKYYGDNNLIYYEAKPLNKRFTVDINISLTSNKYFASAAKSIVRGGLQLKWSLFPHYINNKMNCRPDGNILYNYNILNIYNLLIF